MIVKTDDAHKKVCLVGLAGNDGSWCVGDRCMAWRYVNGESDEGYCGMCPVEPNRRQMNHGN